MKRKIIIGSGYVLGAFIIIFGTFALVAWGNGYSYDFKQGKLVHRGLVLIDTKPGGAKITLGNKQLKKKTPYRQTFEQGEYEFTLAKDGYRTWNKRIEVVPAQVSQHQYVILMPQHFQVDTFASYQSVSQTLASADRHRMAFVVPGSSSAGVWMLDTSNRNQNRVYTIALGADGQPTESLQLMSWSGDDSHVLVKRQGAAGVEWLILAASGNDQPINVTADFKTEFTDLRFNPNNWRELYSLSAGALRRLDTSQKTTTGVLADSVINYTPAEDRLAYVQQSAQGQNDLWSLDRGGKKQRIASNLPTSASYYLDYATYINSPQIVVSAPDAGKVIRVNDAFGDHPQATTFAASATTVDFNADGRFVMLSDGQHLTTYDLERQRLYTFPEVNSKATGISWFDNYHLQFNRNGQMVMSEYDGNYAVAFTRGTALPPTNAGDNRSIFVVATNSAGAYQLREVTIRQ